MVQIGANDTDQDLQMSRIKLKMKENLKRRKKFLDSKQRTIGIDVDALQEQVREKIIRGEQSLKTAMISDACLRKSIELGNSVHSSNIKSAKLKMKELKDVWHDQMKKYKSGFLNGQLDVDINNPNTYHEYNSSSYEDFIIKEDYEVLRSQKKKKQREQFEMLTKQTAEQEKIATNTKLIDQNLYLMQSDMLRKANVIYKRDLREKYAQAKQVQEANIELHLKSRAKTKQ